MLDRVRAWFTAPLESELSSLRGDLATANIRLADAERRASSYASGVPFVYGRFDYEAVAAFAPDKRGETTAKMMADAHVKAALRANTLPLVNAEWEFKPASDKSRDEEIADFCNAVLLRRQTEKFGREFWTRTSWTAQRLPEILTMLDSGFSMFAKSWRSVNGKRVVDLTWLEPGSVDPRGWELDGADNIVTVRRTFTTPASEFKILDPVPVKDLALYVHDLRGARYEGTPFIRSMYGAWFRKDFLQRQSLIWAQKVGAPSPMGAYPAGWSEQDVAKFRAFVQQLRGVAPAENWGVFPQDADGKPPVVEFAGAAVGEVDRLGTLIEAENSEIAHSGGTKAGMLGETSTGSRAVGQTISSLEYTQTEALGKLVCEWENHGVANLSGIVEELVLTNFAGAKAMPELTVSKVRPDEQTRIIPLLLDAVKAGLVPKHEDLMRQVTERLGFVLPDDAYEIQEPVSPFPGAPLPPQLLPNGDPDPRGGPPAATGDGATDTGSEPEEQDGTPEGPRAAAEGRRLGDRLHFADVFRDPVDVAPGDGPPTGLGRPPTQFEAKYVALGAVKSTLREGEERMGGVLRRAHREQITDLVTRGRAGKITDGTLGGLRRSNPRGKGAQEAEVRRLYVSVAAQGREHVVDELARQKRAVKDGTAGTPPDQTARATLAALPPGAKIPAKVNRKLARPAAELLSEAASEARVYAELAVDAIWDRLTREASAEFMRLQSEGLAGDALWDRLQAFLDGLSENPVLDAGRRTSSVAYATGRDLGAMEALGKGAAGWALRSEVLDNATCEVCQGLDGMGVEIGSAEYYEFMPPNKCDGSERCRGFYVVLDADLVAAQEPAP